MWLLAAAGAQAQSRRVGGRLAHVMPHVDQVAAGLEAAMNRSSALHRKVIWLPDIRQLCDVAATKIEVDTSHDLGRCGSF